MHANEEVPCTAGRTIFRHFIHHHHHFSKTPLVQPSHYNHHRCNDTGHLQFNTSSQRVIHNYIRPFTPKHPPLTATLSLGNPENVTKGKKGWSRSTNLPPQLPRAMDDDILSQFTGITGADPARAQQYLTITDHNLEQAIQLYFESDGVDMGGTIGGNNSNQSQPSGGVVNLDSDEENDDPMTGVSGTLSASRRNGPSVEDDEAIARRMQEEMYGGAGGVGGGADDMGGMRAPVARTAETLLGPGADWREDPDEMNAAILEQLQSRQRRTGTFEPCLNRKMVIWLTKPSQQLTDQGSSTNDPHQVRYGRKTAVTPRLDDKTFHELPLALPMRLPRPAC